MIEDRDDGVALAGEAPVDVDHGGHLGDRSVSRGSGQSPGLHAVRHVGQRPPGQARSGSIRAMRVLNAAQMREADRITTDDIGIGSLVLMECAGRQVVATLEERVEDLAASRIAVLCGPGNNGGDGFVVRARSSRPATTWPSSWSAAPPTSAATPAPTSTSSDVLATPWSRSATSRSGAASPRTSRPATLVVDALFGTGLSRPLTGLFETIVHDVNASTLPVVAIDLPSGLSGSTPDVIGPAMEAELTVTFAAPKLPHVLPPAEALCGDVVTVEIGIPSEVVEALDGPRIDVITRDAVAGSLEPREADTHKGDYGRVLIVAGSLGRTGAAYLAAMAALRSGAGLVTVAAPASAVPIIASMGPSS